ncbi:MAG: peptidyl-tRNA hydrolase Pth2 [Candidatus Hydrothermarchaeota archaeon]|nr:peptidyl-tRNA hydrolase Pth2 [Candidatus Hydrothermarchaeota archaeon]
MECKQVIVVRADLKMSKGKTCIQVAHASLSSAEKAAKNAEEWYRAWKKEGQKKVAVKVASEKELHGLYETAKKARLPCCLVQDAGLTELEPGTITALGIGPAPNEMIDRITGSLKLLG